MARKICTARSGRSNAIIPARQACAAERDSMAARVATALNSSLRSATAGKSNTVGLDVPTVRDERRPRARLGRQAAGMSETSLIYRSALGYELVMRALYGRHYAERMRAVAAEVPHGSSVLELCCGPATLYKR